MGRGLEAGQDKETARGGGLGLERGRDLDRF